MASTTTPPPPPPPPEHIVITVSVPTSTQQAHVPTLVWSGPTTSQHQDASVQTEDAPLVDEAPPLNSHQPAQEIAPAQHEIEEVEDESEVGVVEAEVEAESEAGVQAEAEPEVDGASEANVDCFSNLKRSHWLRAAVLGTINGLLAPASVIIDTSFPKISPNLFNKENLSSYLGIISGAATMAMGEYISIRTQLDTQQQRDQAERGSPNPWTAGFLSFAGYLIGALLLSAPFHYLAYLGDPIYPYRVAEFGILVSLEFVVLGWLAAIVGRTRVFRSIIRYVVGGWFVTAITASCFVILYFLHAYSENE